MALPTPKQEALIASKMAPTPSSAPAGNQGGDARAGFIRTLENKYHRGGTQ
ncbi:hypothetical protein ACU4HD_21910 [Cupriavidus basilensis]